MSQSQIEQYQEIQYEYNKIQQEIDYMQDEQIEPQDLKTTKEDENENLKTDWEALISQNKQEDQVLKVTRSSLDRIQHLVKEQSMYHQRC